MDKEFESEYEPGEVTISLDEYRDLCEISARVSILRAKIVSKLKKQLDNKKLFGNKHSRIDDTFIEVLSVCEIMGFLPTFVGFQKKEETIDKEDE